MKITMPDGEIVENKTPQWKTPWNHDTTFESNRTALYCADPSLTKQEFKDDVDINTIIERVMRGGEPPLTPLPEHFIDLTDRTNYFEMQTKIAEANAVFYKQDAELRAQFNNNPSRWADAVVHAVQRDDRKTLRALGIDAPDAAPEPPKPEPPPVSPAKTEGAASAPKAPTGAT